MFEIYIGRRIVQKVSCACVMASLVIVIGMIGPSQAALLDEVMTEWEELLAGHVAKKGDKLLSGNFYTAEKPNAHGPIGMMGEHTHEEGEFMWSYRYMHMFMQETRNGTNTVTDAQGRALVGSLVSPTSMRMEMHMLGAMYGVNDTLTVTVMVPFLRNSMNHVNAAQAKFTTKSEGFGDIKIGSLWRLWAVEAPSIGAHRFHLNFSLGIPTGDIEPTDRLPLMGGNNDFRLPYPMHLGSGTVDLFPGLTYGGEKGRASWGVQSIGTIRLQKNSNGFSKGDAINVNAYGAYEVIQKWLSGSLRFDYNRWGDYDGRDPAIGMTVQTAFPNKLGGERLDMLGGVNLLLPEFMGFETRLAVEGGVPIYQWLQGQLETDSIVTFGWQGVY